MHRFLLSLIGISLSVPVHILKQRFVIKYERVPRRRAPEIGVSRLLSSRDLRPVKYYCRALRAAEEMEHGLCEGS